MDSTACTASYSSIYPTPNQLIYVQVQIYLLVSTNFSRCMYLSCMQTLDLRGIPSANTFLPLIFTTSIFSGDGGCVERLASILYWRRYAGIDLGEAALPHYEAALPQYEAALPHAALGTHVYTHTFSTTLNTGYVLLWCLLWRRNSATLTSNTRLADRYHMCYNMRYICGLDVLQHAVSDVLSLSFTSLLSPSCFRMVYLIM